MELFVDATQCARMPVLLVKPCSMGTHWRCLIVKILLGEGLENFRFFRCPEDVSFHFVYHTKAWSQWSWMSILSFKQFYLHTKIIAPRITFKCLMHLRHLQHRHVNSFVFSFQSFLSFVPIVYNLWLSSSALSIACKFIQTNLRKFHFRKLIERILMETEVLALSDIWSAFEGSSCLVEPCGVITKPLKDDDEMQVV